jgi:hypothetical protein
MTKIKKFNQQYFRIILILFTVLFGCTKDIDVKDQYDWNMILTMEQDGFVFEQETLTVSLIQERIITSDVFFSLIC